MKHRDGIGGKYTGGVEEDESLSDWENVPYISHTHAALVTDKEGGPQRRAPTPLRASQIAIARKSTWVTERAPALAGQERKRRKRARPASNMAEMQFARKQKLFQSIKFVNNALDEHVQGEFREEDVFI